MLLVTAVRRRDRVASASLAREQQVFAQRYAFDSRRQGGAFLRHAGVRDSEGAVECRSRDRHRSGQRLGILQLALINDDTGVAYDFGKEVSYYFGRDSDGSWTEGADRQTVYDSRRSGGPLLSARRAGDGQRRPASLCELPRSR